MALHKIITKLLQPFWRLTRGQTLGAQGMIIDQQDRVLLIRHGYRPGWHFPGGGVEWGETVEMALSREVVEETGVQIRGPVELHGIFANFEQFPGDHVAFYIVRHWRQGDVPAANSEIAEQGFFAPDSLPGGAADPVRRRLSKVFEGKPRQDAW